MRRYGVRKQGLSGPSVGVSKRNSPIGHGDLRLSAAGYGVLLLALIMSTALPAVSAQGATVSIDLGATADAYVELNTPNSNFGTGDSMDIGRFVTPSDRTRRTLVQFDLSSVPAGVTIQNATMVLICDQATGTPVNYSLFRNTASWGETSVTWNTQPSREASPSFTRLMPSSCASDTPLQHDATSLVNAWLTGPNFGLIAISSNETHAGHINLDTRELSVGEFGPRLFITWIEALPSAGAPGIFALAVGLSTFILIAALINILLNGIEKATDVFMIVVAVTFFVVTWGAFLATGF